MNVSNFITLCFAFVLLTTGCNSSKSDLKIVGGVPAEPHEFPYIVSINFRLNTIHLCSGMIVAEDVVVTSGHCVLDHEAKYLIVIAGDHYKNVTEDSEQIIEVEKFTVHSEYDPVTFKNDIAVLLLASRFEFNNDVMAMKLPAENFTMIDTVEATVAGWGTEQENPKVISNVLRKVDLPIVSNEECNRNYSDIEIDPDYMICAGAEGKDSCLGDAGGPLLCHTPTHELLPCGIVTFGNGCGLPGYPGVYLRLSPYRKWIESNEASIPHISVFSLLLFIMVCITP